MNKQKYEKSKIINTTWQEEPAIKLCAGGYEALIIPGIGANLIELKNTVKELNLLRTPDDIDIFRNRPQVYGIPVLFPPNRIQDGTFKANGKTYNFPVNEIERNNHIHGFLHKKTWEIESMNTPNDDCAEIQFVFKANNTTDFYKCFPHDFEFRLLYSLSSEGLVQKVSIKNNSDTPMPVGLGFHTAFRIPFHAESNYKDYIMKVSIDKMWELNERVLPTSKLLPLTPYQEKYRNEGLLPLGDPMDHHYTASPIKINDEGFHGAIIEDTSKGVQLVYEVGEKYKHWVLWNASGNEGFVCPEPQSWAINAPNIELDDKITGFYLLNPDSIWEESCKIFVRKS